MFFSGFCFFCRVRRQYGKNGYKYRPQYGVLVRCKDEAHQQALYKQLTALGLKVKVVCV